VYHPFRLLDGESARDRDRVRAAVGEEAEALAHAFSHVDRPQCFVALAPALTA
jgi:hypothetical protein